MEKQDCISNGLKRKTGIDLAKCYQCGKCSAGCAIVDEMEFSPSYIMRLLQTNNPKNDASVLQSEAIWLCVNCENCVSRCPNQVDLPIVMDYLRSVSLKKNCVNRKAHSIVAFHSAFLDSLKYTGRLYEVGLIADYKLRTHNWFQDISLVPSMLSKGKLSIMPEYTKDGKCIKRIFTLTFQNNKNCKL